MEANITSQDWGIRRLFVESWRLYRANFRSIFWVTLCVSIPVNLLVSLIPTEALLKEFGVRGIELYFNIVRLIQFLIGTIAIVATAAIVEKAIQGGSYSWLDALQYGLSKWTRVFGTDLLSSVILLGLTLLFIIPGIIWSGYYSFWMYVVALRNISGKAALDYSKSLVEGQWWRVFGILLLVWLTAFATGLIVTFPLNQISGNRFYLIIPGTVADIVDAFFTVVVLVYFLNNDYRRKPAHFNESVLPAGESEA